MKNLKEFLESNRGGNNFLNGYKHRLTSAVAHFSCTVYFAFLCLKLLAVVS